MKLLGFLLLGIFYSVYLGKLLFQKNRGIQTDQMAKGKEKGRRFYTELVMKLTAYGTVAAEIISILAVPPRLPKPLVLCGTAIGLLGDIVFILAVVTMRDSWRAGIAEGDNTELITGDIYQFSRNPAFLGFDCLYLGLLLMFFNLPLLVLSVFAMLMFHLQILQEEQYLSAVFGQRYKQYQNRVRRYWGRKRLYKEKL